MPIEVTFNYDGQFIQRVINATPKAAAAALNETAKSMQTQITRKVSEIYHIPQSQMRTPSAKAPRPFYIKEATISNLVVEVIPSRVRMSLGRWPIRWRPTMSGAIVSLDVQRTYLGQFRATMQSGHIGVFKRRGSTFTDARGWKRQHIFEHMGPSIAGMARRQEVREVVASWVKGKLWERVLAKVQFYAHK
jgi:hypothetical protein